MSRTLPAHYNDLDVALNEAWSHIETGARDRRSPFHIFSIASVTAEGEPSVRSVVLRGADRNRNWLRFHSDFRSSKFSDFRHSNRIMAHFYSPADAIQLRLRGSIRLEKSPGVIEDKWDGMRPASQLCYRQPVAPGQIIGKPEIAETGLFDDPTARDNLVLVDFTAESLEWLYLSSAGHRRARFEFSRDGYRKTWLAP